MTALPRILPLLLFIATGALWAAEPTLKTPPTKKGAVDLLPVVAVDNPKQPVDPAPGPSSQSLPSPALQAKPAASAQPNAARAQKTQADLRASEKAPSPNPQPAAAAKPTSPAPVAATPAPVSGVAKPGPASSQAGSGPTSKASPRKPATKVVQPTKQTILLENGEQIEIDAVVSAKPGPKGARVISTTVVQRPVPSISSTQIKPLETPDIVPTVLEPVVTPPPAIQTGSAPSPTSQGGQGGSAPAHDQPAISRPFQAQDVQRVQAPSPVQPQSIAPGSGAATVPSIQVPAESNAPSDHAVLPAQRKPGEVFQVSQGVTHIVKIARGLVNRIVTPFERPRVLTASSIQYKDEGSALYVATPSTTPVGLFISDSTGSRAISLTLVPDDIPQREITLALDNTYVARAPQDSSEPANASNDYVEQLKGTLREVSQGIMPQGYTLVEPAPHLMPQCSQVGIATALGQVLESHAYRIGVFVVTNASRQPLQIYEQGCYRRGVVAVAAWPRAFLEPGQDTELFVVTRRNAFGHDQGGRDRPRLVRD